MSAALSTRRVSHSRASPATATRMRSVESVPTMTRRCGCWGGRRARGRARPRRRPPRRQRLGRSPTATISAVIRRVASGRSASCRTTSDTSPLPGSGPTSRKRARRPVGRARQSRHDGGGLIADEAEAPQRDRHGQVALGVDLDRLRGAAGAGGCLEPTSAQPEAHLELAVDDDATRHLGVDLATERSTGSSPARPRRRIVGAELWAGADAVGGFGRGRLWRRGRYGRRRGRTGIGRRRGRGRGRRRRGLQAGGTGAGNGKKGGLGGGGGGGAERVTGGGAASAPGAASSGGSAGSGGSALRGGSTYGSVGPPRGPLGRPRTAGRAARPRPRSRTRPPPQRALRTDPEGQRHLERIPILARRAERAQQVAQPHEDHDASWVDVVRERQDQHRRVAGGADEIVSHEFAARGRRRPCRIRGPEHAHRTARSEHGGWGHHGPNLRARHPRSRMHVATMVASPSSATVAHDRERRSTSSGRSIRPRRRRPPADSARFSAIPDAAQGPP